MAKLTDKQKAFIEYYLQTWNATEAARRAEYKGNDVTLAAVGYENLRKPHIREVINNRMKELTLSSDEVLLRLAQQAKANIADFYDENGLVDFQKVKEKGFLIRRLVYAKGKQILIELHDPQTALIHLGRHYQLFTDKVKIEDWRSEIIQLLKEGKLTREQVIEELGKDLATELFVSAGISITSS